MEFVINGVVKIVQAGESVNLPQNTLHTFSNKSNSVCKWINIHSPKGFRKFFEKLGVSEEEQGAQQKSISKSIINEVMDTAVNYDMLIKL